MVFVYDLGFVLIKLNIQKNMSFLIPHSSLLYHSTNNSHKSQHNQHSPSNFVEQP